VVEEVGRYPTRVVPVFAPTEVARRVECTFRRRTEEGLPVKILLVCLRVNSIVPFATLIRVAPEPAGRPDDLANETVLDRLFGFQKWSIEVYWLPT
jgi:hypothetical protein